MAELAWSVAAVGDLDDIAEYIRRSSPAYALLFVRRIVLAAERVRGFPRLGRIVPEIGSESVREVLFQNYRLMYVIDGDFVTILAVVHGAVDLGGRTDEDEWDLT